MRNAINPVTFAGFLLAATALAVLLMEVYVRWLGRSGLTQGGLPPRPRESFAAHTERSRQYDRRQLDLLRRRRPATVAALTLGIALVVVGALF